MAGSPTFFAGGSTPHLSDSGWMILQRILGATIDGGGGGGNPEPGVVDPEGNVPADPGAIYWNSANGTLWVKDEGSGSGSSGWTQLI